MFVVVTCQSGPLLPRGRCVSQSVREDSTTLSGKVEGVCEIVPRIRASVPTDESRAASPAHLNRGPQEEAAPGSPARLVPVRCASFLMRAGLLLQQEYLNDNNPVRSP